MRGAGGSSGGIGQFMIGFIMMCSGSYMLLNAIRVTSNFGMGQRLYGFSAFGGNVGINTGMIMIPFIFGVGFIFYNSRNPIGWLLAIGSLVSMALLRSVARPWLKSTKTRWSFPAMGPSLPIRILRTILTCSRRY